MMVYQWRDGCRIGVDPNEAGAELERIREAHGGALDEGDVVEASRPVKAPLHRCFLWDDTQAANRYREYQARTIIRSIVIVQDGDGDPEPRKVIAYVHVKPDDSAASYLPTSRVMSDDALRAQAIGNALSLLNGVKRRYEHLTELAPVFSAIDKAAAKLGYRSRKPVA